MEMYLVLIPYERFCGRRRQEESQVSDPTFHKDDDDGDSKGNGLHGWLQSGVLNLKPSKGWMQDLQKCAGFSLHQLPIYGVKGERTPFDTPWIVWIFGVFSVTLRTE